MIAREPERRARRLAVERQVRHAVAGGGAERVLLGALQHAQDAGAVVRELGREAARPELHRARHRGLHVRVARQIDLALLAARRARAPPSTLRGAGRELADRVAQVEAQRDEHLVVARAAEMHAPARFADPLGEPALERAVHVLVRELDRPLARGVLRGERLEAVADRRAVGGREQTLGLEHPRVRDRRAHVVGHEPLVEHVILARGEAQDPLVERQTFVPEARHRR